MSWTLIAAMKRAAKFLGNDLNIYLKTVLEMGLQTSGCWCSCGARSSSVICSVGPRIVLDGPCSLAAGRGVCDARHACSWPGS